MNQKDEKLRQDTDPQETQEWLESLQAVISQRLLPKADGKGRAAALEVMLATAAIRDLIKDRNRVAEIKDYIEKSREMYGTQSFDQHLIELYQGGVLSLEVARGAATNPADFERALYVN